MIPLNSGPNRRNFLKTTAAITTGLAGFASTTASAKTYSGRETPWAVVGPREGFAPHIGTMYSMMTMMRHMMLQPVKGLTVEQLDYLIDSNSNSIGAMLLHLAGTETYYQLNTFGNMRWGSWSDDVKKKWDIPMNLGEEGRKQIKGKNLEFYLAALKEVREKTLAELKKRDDKWLAEVDPSFFGNQPTNNYCKWFHVCEHESNHNGQIKWIKGRLPETATR